MKHSDYVWSVIILTPLSDYFESIWKVYFWQYLVDFLLTFYSAELTVIPLLSVQESTMVWLKWGYRDSFVCKVKKSCDRATI